MNDDIKTEDRQAARAIRRYQLTGLFALGVVVAGSSFWAAQAKIQGAVIAQASVAVRSNAKKIQHLHGGSVAKIAVQDGAHVKAGDLLLRLDDTEDRANFIVLLTQIAELSAKRARLEAERDGTTILASFKVLPHKPVPGFAKMQTANRLAQRKLLRARRDMRHGLVSQLKEQAKQFSEQIRGFEAQLKAKSAQHKLLEKELRTVRKLFRKKLVTQNRLLSLQRERATLAGARGGLLSSIAETRGKISESRLKILQMGHEWHTEVLAELRDISGKLSELRERGIAARSRLSHADIRAPISGVVHGLSVHTVGGVVASGEALMQIIPAADQLVFNAKVAPADIDQVRQNQLATIRLPVFDQRKVPEIKGRVTFIAADLSEDDPQVPPYYAVRLELGAADREKLAKLRLIPGMPAEIYIETTGRTVLSYLLKPLKDQFSYALRDG